MIRWHIFSLILLLGWACATPVPPSGGPVDKTPPDLVGMYPPSNSVDFDGSTVRFEFSERVDRAAFEPRRLELPASGSQQGGTGQFGIAVDDVRENDIAAGRDEHLDLDGR